jgi:hypothetical protein
MPAGDVSRRRAFTGEVRRFGGDPPADIAARIFDWVDANGLRDSFEAPHQEKGETYGPVIPGFDWTPSPIVVTAKTQYVAVRGSQLKGHLPFKNEFMWTQLHRRLDGVPDVVRTRKEIFPHIALTALADGEAWRAFFDVVDWIVERIRATAPRDLL